MKTLDEKIAVMQAAARGETIECCTHGSKAWGGCNPSWNWDAWDYRVAPAKPREFLIVCMPTGQPYYAQEIHGGKSDLFTFSPLKTIRLREIVDGPAKVEDCRFRPGEFGEELQQAAPRRISDLPPKWNPE
jgi:hypothetical protein